MTTEIYIDSFLKTVDKLGMQKISINKEGRPSGRGNKNSNKLGSQTCSWYADLETYSESISGLKPTDRCVFDSAAGITTFRGQRVQPSFSKLMDLCFPYHLEVRFGGVPTSDGERMEMIHDFVSEMNWEYAQSLKCVKAQDPRGPDSKREYVMVRAVLFNEFVSFDEEPRLHVLFSLAPTHLIEMVDEFAEQLKGFADNRCPDCVPVMEINRVTDQSKLLLRLTGIHKDRAFRQFPEVI